MALLEVTDLRKVYRLKSGLRTYANLVAADDISITVDTGETLALVGESGSGKTTVGRCVLRLEEPTAGTVTIAGQTVTGLPKRELRNLRHDMQMVFQDPSDSLNPRHTVGDLVAEPLLIHGIVTGKRELRAELERLFAIVGLGPQHLDRYPHQISGGQQQRVGIARALAPRPKLMVLDEPTSALDVSVQAQVINLLQRIQRETNLAFLFISHDLAVVSLLADRIAVMYLGQIVELASKQVVLGRPAHPYTRALISAIPVEHPSQKRERITMRGEPLSPIDPPPHCHLVSRCPFAQPICSEVPAELVEVTPGHATRCVRFQREHQNGSWNPRPTETESPSLTS
jgi:oligopeptide/dipeptide ABC transporter ATP-binding protein